MGNKRSGKTVRVSFLAKSAVVSVALLAGMSQSLGATTVAPPVFGQFFDAAHVRGSVFVTPPGQGRTALATTRQLPVGSTVDVATGTVQVTAADGKGGTYSGQFSNGSFEVLQSATGSGTTEIRLVGSCVKTAIDAPQAIPARRPRHRAPVYRQLQIDANGDFDVVGSSASAMASGQAVYSLTDQCNGTHIVAQNGNVQAQSKSTGAYTLKPRESLIDHCHPNGSHPHYCQLMVSRPDASVFSFGLLLTHATASHYQVCYTTPRRKTSCHTGPLGPKASRLKAGGLSCIVNDGRGEYPVRWLVDGRKLGITLRFKDTQPFDIAIGSDSCSGFPLNS